MLCMPSVRSLVFLIVVVALIAVVALSSRAALAEESVEQLLSLSLYDLLRVEVQVGARTGDKRLLNHRLPVDIVTADDLRRTGYGDLPKALNHLVASFTYEFSTIDDLTDHVRPFSINGLKGDQVLVLINGKRVHQSAVIDVNDSQNFGSSSVDLSLIPIESIERVEILRDDASAQYGSDAIAGVINVVLKQRDANEAVITAGQRQAGDGEILVGHYSYGRDQIFASLEYKKKNRSNTSGLDRRDYYFDGDPRNGHYRVTHIYGDPQAESLNLVLNANELFGNSHLYTIGKLAYKKSEATGFFRLPRDDRTVRGIYPDGFLPVIAPEQRDLFATFGYRGQDENSSYDISNTVGYNQMKIRVENSLNASLGLDSPRQFYAGDLRFWQNTLNVDATRVLGRVRGRPLNLAYGGEYRHERTDIGAGEWASWGDGLIPVLDGPNIGTDTVGGAQLYPGFTPGNANELDRDVGAFYVEANYPFAENVEVGASLRDENYSDFGNTLNGKLFLNVRPVENFNVRASLSTGYRAPSLQQMNYYHTATSYAVKPDGNVGSREYGVFPVEHEAVRLLGAQALKPEESQRFSLGMNWQISEPVQLSLDYFQIRLDDRIILSGDIVNNNLIPIEAQLYMTENHISYVRYFLNGVDTSTKGMDASLNYKAFISGHEFNVNAQLHYQETGIDAVNLPNQITALAGEVFDRSERERLMHYLPERKALVSATYAISDWMLLVRANYFGKVLYVSSSEEPERDQWFGSRTTVDLDITRQLSRDVSISLGGHNIFNVHPDARNSEPPFNGEGNIFPYRGISPFDYTGAFWFMRVNAGF
ncbi:tonB-dependent receptor [gamma proteobacterium HdN1]|nr:tonB-dependent receptor [gamma proteobacterium HdN1]